MNKRLIIMVVVFLFAFCITLSYYIYKNTLNNQEIVQDNSLLPTVGNKEKLKSLIENNNNRDNYMNFGVKDTLAQATESSADYSTTNVQVAGVDESDVVKTDGKYIYSISDGKIVISEVYPENNMKVIKTLLEEEEITPIEFMIDDKYLTVICNENLYYNKYDGTTKEMMDIMPYYGSSKTLVYIYDITNKNNITLADNYSVDGNYITSRKVDSIVYVLTNKYTWNYNGNEEIRPMYKENEVEKYIGYDSIYYFPDTSYNNFTIISSVNLNNLNEELKLTTYLASINDVYMSLENLYITNAEYNYSYLDDIISNKSGQTSTNIYKFNIASGEAIFKAKANLTGTIINQFSMDEYNNNFRIALTNNESNSVFVLDKNMKLLGSIKDIAPGERIYSTKFIKDRLYMVTFKTMDPLFVIDLKDSTNPKILGELKIPGFSNYLHEYDENHIIGIGQETEEIFDKDSKGNVINTRYVTTGMKMALFDVTDVSKPIQKFSTKIGDKYTYSEILYNHKALLFSKEKNLLAIPVDIYKNEILLENSLANSQVVSSSSSATSNRFQGLLVYNIDLEKGFTERGRITHYTDNKVYSYYLYNYFDNISRGVYINNVLYTVSGNKIKANDLNTLKEINELVINDSKNNK